MVSSHSKFLKPLAGNPTGSLKYAVNVKNINNETIEVPDPRATRAMIALMDMTATLGGAACHYGGPAAFAELMSALYSYVFETAKKQNKEWHSLFNLVNDAGHCENGLYALKANYGFAGLTIENLRGFRSIQSPLAGHGEAHLFPEGVLLSNGPLGSAFAQAQGLAMADAMSGNNRVTVVSISDGACMEGDVRESLAAIPGFAGVGKMAPFVMIISDNNTKLSGRIDKDSFSLEPTFKSLEVLGWKLVSVEDGHDLQKCFSTLEAAIIEAQKNPKQPIAIHARTIKGIGTKKTAESSSGGHGFPLKSPMDLPQFLLEIFEGKSYPDEFKQWTEDLIQLEKAQQTQLAQQAQHAAANPAPINILSEKIQVGISAALVRARKEGHPLVSITSDLPGSTGLASFIKEFPQYSVDVGIAESNMISVAAGFSRLGYLPVVDTFAQFGVTKGALPLIMSALSQSPMIGIFSHTGFQDAADGASHQSLSYLAMTSSIQNIDVYCLTCSSEAEALLYQTIEKFSKDRQAGMVPRSTLFFLGRENFPRTFQNGASYKLGQSQIVIDNSDQYEKSVAIFASGSLLVEAISASKQLSQSGFGSLVVNPGIHNVIDLEVATQVLKKSEGRLVSVEDHQQIGGYGQMLAHALLLKACDVKMKSLAVKGDFGQSSYTAQELYKKFGLDSDHIVQACKDLLTAKRP